MAHARHRADAMIQIFFGILCVPLFIGVLVCWRLGVRHQRREREQMNQEYQQELLRSRWRP
jgi:hypothetical protein